MRGRFEENVRWYQWLGSFWRRLCVCLFVCPPVWFSLQCWFTLFCYYCPCLIIVSGSLVVLVVAFLSSSCLVTRCSLLLHVMYASFLLVMFFKNIVSDVLLILSCFFSPLLPSRLRSRPSLTAAVTTTNDNPDLYVNAGMRDPVKLLHLLFLMSTCPFFHYFP